MKAMKWSKDKLATAICLGVVLSSSVSTVAVAQPQGAVTTATSGGVSDDALLITPRVSVGEVKAGMTEDEVIAALGQPDRQQGDVLIYDAQFGFSVVCNRQKIVRAVHCGGPVSFKCRTKEGIGVGSSKDELIKAYGQPADWAKTPAQGNQPAQDLLDYTPLGLNFTLHDSKVYSIVVNLRKPQ